MTVFSLDHKQCEGTALMLKALAHPIRIGIVAILCEGDERVGEIALRLGAKQAIVSQQLRILRMSELVGVVKENGYSRYTLLEPRLKQLVQCLKGCKKA